MTKTRIQIITTVGTSLFANFFEFETKFSKKRDAWWTALQEDSNNNKRYYSEKTWNNHKIQWVSIGDKSFPEEVKKWAKRFNKKASAELHSIAEIARGYEEVDILLLPSYTLDGYLAASLIKEVLEQSDILGGISVHVILKPAIEGLVVDSATLFKQKGVENLIRIITDEIYKRELTSEIYRLLCDDGPGKTKKRLINKDWFRKDITDYLCPNNPDEIDIWLDSIKKGQDYRTLLNEHPVLKSTFTENTDLVFNISGGYKGIVPILTILGQIYSGIEVKYLYEESSEIITIPGIPVHFDWDILRMYGPYLNEDTIRHLNETNASSSILRDMKLLNLIDEQNDLSVTGRIIQRYLKQNTPMDNSVIGDYFEYVLYEAIVEHLMEDTKRKAMVSIKKGFKPDYLKSVGDIDVFVELHKDTSNMIYMFEAKSIYQVTHDIESVMNKVHTRLDQWRSHATDSSGPVTLVLAVWHFPEDSQVETARQILNAYQPDDSKNVQFQHIICQIAFSGNNSITGNGYNTILRKTRVDVSSLFN